jgi:hypothetical protein
MTDKIKEATEAFANAFGILVNDFIKLAIALKPIKRLLRR